MQRGAETRDRLLVALDRVGSDPSRAKFLPLRAPWHDQTVLIDGETGEVLGVVDVDPWDSPQGTKP